MDVFILFAMVIGLMLIGVPIAVSLGLSSILFLLALSDTSLAAVAASLYNGDGRALHAAWRSPSSCWPPASCPRAAWRGGSSVSPSRWSAICRAVWRLRASLPA